jgi:hypothetical protein
VVAYAGLDIVASAVSATERLAVAAQITELRRRVTARNGDPGSRYALRPIDDRRTRNDTMSEGSRISDALAFAMDRRERGSENLIALRWHHFGLAHWIRFISDFRLERAGIISRIPCP